MSKKHKRDIYRGRNDAGFDINKDVDLAHLRELMTVEEPTPLDYNYYGLYCKNIIKIMLNSSNFRGYADDVKEDMEGRAMIDMIKARTKFKGDKYPQPTAPFNYLFRIGFHSFQHELSDYYKMRDKMVPASLVGSARLMDSSEYFDDDILDGAAVDWDEIVLNLKSSVQA